MEIIFLGTGGAFTRQYYQTNLLVKWKRTNLLIDCGATCAMSLHQCGISLGQIENVFISHTHADHIGGLEELALRNRYQFQRKINLYLPQPLVAPLWNQSLRGGLQHSEEGKLELADYFNVHSVVTNFTIADIRFELVPTKHVKGMKSFGLCFNRVFYSNDTQYDDKLLLAMAARCDLLIHDCSFAPNPVHTNYMSLLSLPPEIRKRVYLIHYDDNSEPRRQYMRDQGFNCAETHSRLRLVNCKNRLRITCHFSD